MAMVLILGGAAHREWHSVPGAHHGAKFQLVEYVQISINMAAEPLDQVCKHITYRIVEFRSGDHEKSYFAAVQNHEPDWMALDRLFAGDEQ